MKKGIRNLLIFVLLGMSVYFAYLAYQEYKPIAESKVQKEAMKEVAVIDNNDPYNRIVDFKALKKINEDIVGWIYIPGTSIDYPILIGDTDSEYLYKDMEGKSNVVGSIFSYSSTNRDLSDARILLFGHNMIQYQMFGELRRYYMEDDFRASHNKMYIYTEKRTMELDLFSIFTCLETDEFFWNTPELGTAEYQDLLQKICDKNEYSDINDNNKIKNIADLYNNQTFSLVTCKGNEGTVYRLVINGIVTKEKYILH